MRLHLTGPGERAFRHVDEVHRTVAGVRVRHLHGEDPCPRAAARDRPVRRRSVRIRHGVFRSRRNEVWSERSADGEAACRPRIPVASAPAWRRSGRLPDVRLHRRRVRDASRLFPNVVCEVRARRRVSSRRHHLLTILRGRSRGYGMKRVALLAVLAVLASACVETASPSTPSSPASSPSMPAPTTSSVPAPTTSSSPETTARSVADTVMIPDPVGDTTPATPGYLDTTAYGVSWSDDGSGAGMTLSFVFEVAKAIPASFTVPMNFDAAEYSFCLDTDWPASPGGYPFTGNKRVPCEFILTAVSKGKGWTGTLIDRRPLDDGGKAKTSEADFFIDDSRTRCWFSTPDRSIGH